MTFPSSAVSEIGKVGAGERQGSLLTVLAYASFEDGLKIGRFAKFADGRLDNMDGSATPVVAGVVLRDVGNSIENANEFKVADRGSVDAIRTGLVTVRVAVGQQPVRFQRVYASNDGDANDGMATTVANTNAIATSCEFVEEVQSGVWLINCNFEPADETQPTAIVYAITPPATELAQNDTLQMVLTADGEPVADPVWVIAPVDALMTIDEDGLVTAVGPFVGDETYTITATGYDGLSAGLTTTAT